MSKFSSNELVVKTKLSPPTSSPTGACTLLLELVWDPRGWYNSSTASPAVRHATTLYQRLKILAGSLHGLEHVGQVERQSHLIHRILGSVQCVSNQSAHWSSTLARTVTVQWASPGSRSQLVQVTRNVNNVTKYLVELFVFLVIVEVFSMVSIVGCCNGGRVCLVQLSFSMGSFWLVVFHSTWISNAGV